MESNWKVTGVDRSGKRFRILTDNAVHARGINVWQGTLWLRIGNHWRIIRRYYN
jgi:hypothetical protein